MGEAERVTPEALAEMARGLDPGILGEVADFIGYLKAKKESELDAETRAWMDSDLSRLGEVEPYAWGDQDPLAGEPVYWDEERQALMVMPRD